VLALCKALLEINKIYLLAHPDTPPLYQAGVRYRKQRVNQDRWFDIPRIRRMGCGSCEDLAPWLTAELQLRGEPAGLVVTMTSLEVSPGKPFTLYHVLTERANGQLEDPSAVLGMPVSPHAQIQGL
jgi:hypothetical protein